MGKLYVVGAVFGNLRILSVSERTYVLQWKGYSKRVHYLTCECTECGAISDHTRADLSNAKTHNRKRCSSCATKNLDFTPHATTKLCPKCYGISDRRPLHGPCVCSEHYAVDVIYYEECMINRSPVAIAQGMI